MYTLGVETSSHLGSLALFNDAKLVDSARWSRVGSHSEFLSSSLEVMLHKQKISLRDLHRLAVGIGPGSFTGIRVGINFARTLGYTLNLPVFNLNSLHLLASQPLPPTTSIFRVAQYAFRNLLYTAAYQLDDGRIFEIEPPCALTIEQVLLKFTEPTLVLGSGAELLLGARDNAKSALIVRNPDLHDEPKADFFRGTQALDERPSHLTDWIHTIPLYVRASEAEEKLKTNGVKT